MNSMCAQKFVVKKTFPCRTTWSQHNKKCKFPSLEKPFEKLNNGYRCNKSNQFFKHPNNLPRHKTRCLNKTKLTIPYQHCDKNFRF